MPMDLLAPGQWGVSADAINPQRQHKVKSSRSKCDTIPVFKLRQTVGEEKLLPKCSACNNFRGAPTRLRRTRRR